MAGVLVSVVGPSVPSLRSLLPLVPPPGASLSLVRPSSRALSGWVAVFSCSSLAAARGLLWLVPPVCGGLVVRRAGAAGFLASVPVWVS